MTNKKSFLDLLHKSMPPVSPLQDRTSAKKKRVGYSGRGNRFKKMNGSSKRTSRVNTCDLTKRYTFFRMLSSFHREL